VMPQPDDHTKLAEDVATFLEQDGVLVTVMVLFERRDTLDSASKLRGWLKNKPPSSHDCRLYEQYLKTLYALRVDLSARLFAEAFEVSTDVLIKRNAAPGTEG
jgi:hypothetical protein